MQAILTKYLGPTNFRGARVKATCDAGTVTISYPYELSGEKVHRAAADALLAKLGWDTEGEYLAHFNLVGGGLPEPLGGYAFVFAPKEVEPWREDQAKERHDAHVNLMATCRYCIEEAGPQQDRLIHEEATA